MAKWFLFFFFFNVTSSFGVLDYNAFFKLTLPLVTHRSVLFHKLIVALHYTQFFAPTICKLNSIFRRRNKSTFARVSGLRPSFSLALSQLSCGKSKREPAATGTGSERARYEKREVLTPLSPPPLSLALFLLLSLSLLLSLESLLMLNE